MGKLNRKTALEMVKDKNLEHFTQETFDTMEASGQIAKERGNTERVIKTGNNTYATPMFYYKGRKDAKLSKEQIDLRNKINELITSYTIAKSEIPINKKSK